MSAPVTTPDHRSPTPRGLPRDRSHRIPLQQAPGIPTGWRTRGCNVPWRVPGQGRVGGPRGIHPIEALRQHLGPPSIDRVAGVWRRAEENHVSSSSKGDVSGSLSDSDRLGLPGCNGPAVPAVGRSCDRTTAIADSVHSCWESRRRSCAFSARICSAAARAAASALSARASASLARASASSARARSLAARASALSARAA